MAGSTPKLILIRRETSASSGVAVSPIPKATILPPIQRCVTHPERPSLAVTRGIVNCKRRFPGSSPIAFNSPGDSAGKAEGYTISATTAQAPAPARKAFEKGQQQQKNARWDEAQTSFEKAVSIYPKFARPWFERGRVKLKKTDPRASRHSFRQGIDADSKYLEPYLALT